MVLPDKLLTARAMNMSGVFSVGGQGLVGGVPRAVAGAGIVLFGFPTQTLSASETDRMWRSGLNLGAFPISSGDDAPTGHRRRSSHTSRHLPFEP